MAYSVRAMNEGVRVETSLDAADTSVRVTGAHREKD